MNKLMNKVRKDKKGFTLIELIVIIVILAILTTLALPRFKEYSKKAQLTQIVNDIKIGEEIISIYLVKHDNIPENTTEILTREINKHIKDGTVYTLEGKLTKEVEDQKFYIANDLIKEMNSKLKGDFVVNKGGKVYYINDDTSKYKSEIMTLNLEGLNTDVSPLNKTIDIPGIESIINIEIDTGEMEYEIKDDKVNLTIRGGDITKEINNPKKFSKEVNDSITKTSNKFEDTISYNEDGYIADIPKFGKPTLERKVTGGQWVDGGYWDYEEVHQCIRWVDDAPSYDYGTYCEEWGYVTEKTWVPQRYWQNTYTNYYTQEYKGIAYKAGIDNQYSYTVTIEYRKK